MTDRTPPERLPTREELESLFVQKHGRPETTGWSTQYRFRFGYYLPSDIYESLVGRLVGPGCAWLDVGGGHDIFPQNPGLARALASRCSRLVAVDPSRNVLLNEFAGERVQSVLEDYQSDGQFDLATMRMVVEHVGDPERFAGALARLVKPGGAAVVLTVNRWAPITVVSGLVPFAWHHPIKRFFWGGVEEDTFPVHYKMNTRAELRRLFAQAGFEEQLFARLDDLALVSRFRRLFYLDLLVWRALRRVGLGYPESCILAVFRRK